MTNPPTSYTTSWDTTSLTAADLATETGRAWAEALEKP